MKYGDANAHLKKLRSEIDEIRKEMRATLAEADPEPVDDYEFVTRSGATKLSDLLGKRNELIVIHNMGADCAYCTLWADGYNGLYPHIAQRAAFVIASPDSPDRQASFAQERGWKFPMVSDKGAQFAHRMGYATLDGKCRPGLSVFQRSGNGIVRITDSGSLPHDDFCAAWHLFDLLPGGAANWSPKIRYGTAN